MRATQLSVRPAGGRTSRDVLYASSLCVLTIVVRCIKVLRRNPGPIEQGMGEARSGLRDARMPASQRHILLGSAGLC